MRCGHCNLQVITAAAWRPPTRPERQKLAAWEPAVQWTKHFVHQIAQIWTRLTCHLRCSSADGLVVYHHQSFSSVDKMKRVIVKIKTETTAWRSHCQFVTFITFLFTVTVIRQMAPLFSKVDSDKLWHDVLNEETVICAKFVKDLFNISKVVGRKTKWPRFFGLAGIFQYQIGQLFCHLCWLVFIYRMLFKDSY